VIALPVLLSLLNEEQLFVMHKDNHSMKNQPAAAMPSASNVVPFGLKISPMTFGWVLAISAIFCFSLATPIARGLILEGAAPVGIIAVRMFIATAMHWATLMVTSPSLLRPKLQDMAISIGTGLLNGFGMILYFWALVRLDASITVMLISISPILVLSMLALRGERLTQRHVVRVGLALIGVYLLIGPGGNVDLVGVAMALLAVAMFSSQLVVVQWYLKDNDARTITFYTNLGMLITVAIGWSMQGLPWTPISTGGWVAIVALAVLSTFLARWAMYTAVSYIGSGQMSMLNPVEILLAVIWSILFLHERLALTTWLGGGLILFSALLAIKRINLSRQRPRWRAWIRW
jgi:drug/metabolite transporter (DMT)-like permease